jgi:hypothetical protein
VLIKWYQSNLVICKLFLRLEDADGRVEAFAQTWVAESSGTEPSKMHPDVLSSLYKYLA